MRLWAPIDYCFLEWHWYRAASWVEVRCGTCSHQCMHHRYDRRYGLASQTSPSNCWNKDILLVTVKCSVPCMVCVCAQLHGVRITYVHAWAAITHVLYTVPIVVPASRVLVVSVLFKLCSYGDADAPWVDVSTVVPDVGVQNNCRVRKQQVYACYIRPIWVYIETWVYVHMQAIWRLSLM